MAMFEVNMYDIEVENLYHILDNFIIYPLQVIWVQSVHYFSW